MPTAINQPMPTAQPKRQRRLTGRAVLITLLLFFAVISAVDGVMIYFASKTFRGLDGERSYEAGLQYNREIEAGREQEKLGWKVDAQIERGSAASQIVVRPTDAAGKPLTGLAVNTNFTHPTDRNRDIKVKMTETTPGLYSGEVAAAPGAWLVNLELDRDGKTMFRSKNRIEIK